MKKNNATFVDHVPESQLGIPIWVNEKKLTFSNHHLQKKSLGLSSNQQKTPQTLSQKRLETKDKQEQPHI